MKEHENVFDALKELYEIAEAKGITTDGRPATAADVQELAKESVYNLADLLGMSEIYLGKQENITTNEDVENLILNELMDQPDYESFQNKISEIDGLFQFLCSIVVERKGWESERDEWNNNKSWGLKL